VNYTKRIIENQKLRGHELLPRDLRQKLPPLYSTEAQGDRAIAQVKLCGVNGWEWYATEFDGQDTLFGLVVGYFTELGYFSLSELESSRIPQPKQPGLGNVINMAGYPAVERDLHFQPRSLEEVRKEHHL
jgi:hypothetical protein